MFWLKHDKRARIIVIIFIPISLLIFYLAFLGESWIIYIWSIFGMAFTFLLPRVMEEGYKLLKKFLLMIYLFCNKIS